MKPSPSTKLIPKIQKTLTPDLLKPEFRKALSEGCDPMTGHCYAATEALWHSMGGPKSGYRPTRAKDDDGITHWWLVGPGGEILDPTASQYSSRGIEPPYHRGVGGGFLTKEPSRRAQEIMRRLQASQFYPDVEDVEVFRPGYPEWPMYPVDGALQAERYNPEEDGWLKWWVDADGELISLDSEEDHGDYPEAGTWRGMTPGWVRMGVNKQGGFLYLSFEKGADVERAISKIPQKDRFVSSILVENEVREIPVLEGEDALDAWKHRNDIRHRVKGSIASDSNYWILPNGKRIDIGEENHGVYLKEVAFPDKWALMVKEYAKAEGINPKKLDDQALANLGLDEGFFQELIDTAYNLGWIRAEFEGHGISLDMSFGGPGDDIAKIRHAFKALPTEAGFVTKLYVDKNDKTLYEIPVKFPGQTADEAFEKYIKRGVSGHQMTASGPEKGNILELPLSKILTSQRSYDGAHYNVINKKGSRTEGPVSVWLLDDGRFLLTDGQHRFAEAVKKGKKTIQAEIIGEGYSDYWATPDEGNTFKLKAASYRKRIDAILGSVKFWISPEGEYHGIPADTEHADALVDLGIYGGIKPALQLGWTRGGLDKGYLYIETWEDDQIDAILKSIPESLKARAENFAVDSGTTRSVRIDEGESIEQAWRVRDGVRKRVAASSEGRAKFWLEPGGKYHDLDAKGIDDHQTFSKKYGGNEALTKKGWTRGGITGPTLYIELGKGKKASWVLSKLPIESLMTGQVAVQDDFGSDADIIHIDKEEGEDAAEAWGKRHGVHKKLAAGLSSILYHITDLDRAGEILDENRFYLTPAAWSKAEDEHRPNKKYYYLSTARTPHSRYFSAGATKAILVLDGEALGHRYKGGAVDYWGPTFRRIDPLSTESEDRVWSEKREIPDAKSYINEIHVLVDVGASEMDRWRGWLVPAIQSIARSGIKTWAYKDKDAFLNLDKAKAVPLMSLLPTNTKTPSPARPFPPKGPKTDDDRQRAKWAREREAQRPSYGAEAIGQFLALINVDDYDALPKESQIFLREHWDPSSVFQMLEVWMHNSKKEKDFKSLDDLAKKAGDAGGLKKLVFDTWAKWKGPEGILEKREQAWRDSKKEPIAAGLSKQALEAQGYQFVPQSFNSAIGHLIYVMFNGERIGQISWSTYPDSDYIFPSYSGVDEKHRRKGIGTVLYDMAEQISGKRLEPSDDLSKASYEFWKKRLAKNPKAMEEWRKRGVGQELHNASDWAYEGIQAAWRDEGMVDGHWGSSASGCLFISDNGKVLLLKRSGAVEDPGMWGIPGGAIPVDETGKKRDSLESALAETKEELGGIPAGATRSGSATFKKGNFTFETFAMRVPDEGFAAGDLGWESDDARWFPLNELPANLHPGVQWALDQLGVKAAKGESMDFDELRKAALRLIEDDPAWTSMLDNPASAQALGDLQNALRDARSVGELQAAWESYMDLPWETVVSEVQ